MKRYACCVFLMLHLFLVYGDDLDTMLSLSKLLPSLSSNIAWNASNKNPCIWKGVSCNSSNPHLVIGLKLSNSSLTTTANTTSVAFFDNLCKLSNLQSLDLSLNSLSFVPSSFFSNCSGLSQLNSLNLSNNHLSGNLSHFSGFHRLETLDLSVNSLQGQIPSRIFQLKNLTWLDLSLNMLYGPIPDAIGELSKLEHLALSSNSLTGKIPSGIIQLKNLTFLDLSLNKLSGPIPDAIGELSKLKVLILSSNSLIGKIPTSLASIKTLYLFSANLNNFTGPIPAGITRNLSTLDLSYNQITGHIPPDLLSPLQLWSIDLTSNQLEGSIPGIISRNLFRLRLGGNRLNGSVPSSSSFQLPSSLTYLELEGNQLNGTIPSLLEKCLNLALLNLAGNRLQGELPKELGNLSNLVIMKLEENNLTGNIPVEFTRLVNLNTLNLSQNALTGQIPSEISSFKFLQFLYLEGNKLNGSIPSMIYNMGRLIELQLGDNVLSGTVPRMPSTLSSLNLSRNHFSGPIPSYLGDATQLEILDLSKNNFSGEVPSSLINLHSLTLVDLSYNQLDGPPPLFPAYVLANVTGNDFVANPAPNSSTPTKKKSHILIIVVSIGCAIIGLVLVSAVIFLVVSKRFYRVEDEEGLRLEETPPQIINGCVITSDSVHRSNIDFAKAMEVVSNPNNIMMKTKFSTYYKAVMPSGLSYSVKKLNWSDKIFQMGSVDKFGEELQVLGRLSNSNVMVPLAYVLTSDSAYLFYEHVQKGTVYDFLHKGSETALDWKSRYSIALGIAQGLTFLHGCIQPVLLLDLSTKSIHLKSVKEPQIGDIELCKVIDPSKSTGSLSTVAGSVGYIPPEYAYTMRVTASGNVYSFGVILLELLTGKPAVSNGVELAKWALSSSSRLEQRDQILDSRVSKESLGVQSQMMSVLKVALSCVSLSPEARPKTRNVLRMLFNAR